MERPLKKKNKKTLLDAIDLGYPVEKKMGDKSMFQSYWPLLLGLCVWVCVGVWACVCVSV